jgi:DNA-binding PadR family transcriptional regulator
MGPGRDRLYQLSPEERQAFRRNAERWIQMNPEQQKVLREREKVRRQQLKVEAEAAMNQMGLRLDPNAQGQFEARYLQERRRIERALRQEVEAKRQQELPQLNERLKSEFQSRQGTETGKSTAAPTATAKSRD